MNIKRIYAWLVDFFIICIIQSFLMVIFIIIPLLNNVEIFHVSNIIIKQLCLTFFSTFLLIIRDVIGKKSLGKKIFKLMILDNMTNNEANLLKRIIRNLTWLLGPTEIIFFLITGDRLGDKIAGTKIVEEN